MEALGYKGRETPRAGTDCETADGTFGSSRPPPISIMSGFDRQAGEARRAGYLVLAALISVLGGWWSMWRDTSPKARY